MTEQEIARLETWTLAPLLARLLEERKRLLSLAYAMASSFPQYKGILDVIAYAEAPASEITNGARVEQKSTEPRK